MKILELMADFTLKFLFKIRENRLKVDEFDSAEEKSRCRGSKVLILRINEGFYVRF